MPIGCHTASIDVSERVVKAKFLGGKQVLNLYKNGDNNFLTENPGLR